MVLRNREIQEKNFDAFHRNEDALPGSATPFLPLGLIRLQPAFFLLMPPGMEKIMVPD
jgi:hypothetical protein